MSLENVPLLANRSERLPMVLVLDASGSMSGTPIEELNAGLKILEHDLKTDDEAKRRVRILVVRVSGETATVLTNWVDAEGFIAPHLTSSGQTPLGSGVRIAMSEIRAEMRRLEEQGISRKVPWLWIMTDGAPTDAWQRAASESRAAHELGQVLVYPIAVGDSVDVSTLSSFADGKLVYDIPPESFRAFFKFMSTSARAGSKRSSVRVVKPQFDQLSG